MLHSYKRSLLNIAEKANTAVWLFTFFLSKMRQYVQYLILNNMRKTSEKIQIIWHRAAEIKSRLNFVLIKNSLLPKVRTLRFEFRGTLDSCL